MMSVTFCTGRDSSDSKPYVVVRDDSSVCEHDDLEIRIRVLSLAATWLKDEMIFKGVEDENGTQSTR
jgi:hypothetical protein